MRDLDLTFAFWDYDRTRALADGTVKLPGVNARFESAPIVTTIFERIIRGRAFDVAELGLTYFLRTVAGGDSPFHAIPVFPNGCFRHSAIYVNTASGIRRPDDLAGKTVGELALYGCDAGVWPKGILSDEYGVTPDQRRWVIGGLDWPLRAVDYVPQPNPANVDVTWAPEGADLGAQLESVINSRPRPGVAPGHGAAAVDPGAGAPGLPDRRVGRGMSVRGSVRDARA